MSRSESVDWSSAKRVSASELRPGDAIWTADGEPAVIQEIQFGDAAYIFTTRGTFRRFNKTAPTILRADRGGDVGRDVLKDSRKPLARSDFLTYD